MYDIIDQIINHSWSTGSSEQQYVYVIAGAILIVVTVSIIDLVYRIFSHFWHG